MLHKTIIIEVGILFREILVYGIKFYVKMPLNITSSKVFDFRMQHLLQFPISFMGENSNTKICLPTTKLAFCHWKMASKLYDKVSKAKLDISSFYIK